MSSEFAVKLSLSTLGTFAVLCMDVLAAPVILLLIVMACDYITGLVCAYMSKSLSSRVGISGIIKKLCYLLAAGAACVVDFLLSSGLFGSSGDNFGFTVLILVWLILNELLSILENLCKIGVPLPSFMKSIVEKLKTSSETQMSDSTKDE